MLLTITSYIYHALLLLAAIASAWRWRIADRATRIFTIVLAVTFVVEITAYMLGSIYHDNRAFYRVWAPLELCGYCLYLNYCVSQLRRRAIGWIAGAAGIVTAIAFERIFPEDSFASRFLMVESVLIICGCLYACFTMLLKENDEAPTRYIHFWLVASTLFFFCFSFLSLAMYDAHTYPAVVNLMFNHLINFGNIGMLVGVLYAFIRLPKLLPAS